MPRSSDSSEFPLPLRITVQHPPTGVQFCLQSRSELVDPVVSKGADLSFDLHVRAQREGDGSVRLLGPYAQGPPTARFVYVCSGTSAGQVGSCWTRRAKIPLGGITWTMVEQVQAKPNAILEARFEGTAKDGGPTCATVRLLDGWKLTRK